MAPKEFSAKDGSIKLRVPAKLSGRIEALEGNHSMVFDIGAADGVSCEVLSSKIDMAGFLRATADVIFERLDSIQGKVEAKAIERTDAGSIGGQPFMAIDWVYRVSSDKGPLLGGLKQFVAMKSGEVICCSHVDLGYAKSFRALTTALIESLETTSAYQQPDFSEIVSIAVGDRKSGLGVTTLTRGDNGNTLAYNFTSMLWPQETGSPTSVDTVDAQALRPDGALLVASRATASNGTLNTQPNLTRTDQGDWQVDGKMQNKDVTAILGGDIEPVSFVQQIREREALLVAQDPVGQERSQPSWLAHNPTEASQWQIKATARKSSGLYAIEETAGGISMSGVVDSATGLMLSASMALGPATMFFERVHLEGAP